LDVTIQAQIIEHLKKLQEQTGMSILFITHDLGLVAEIADRVLVLYAGQVVELGAVASLFGNPLMPYTRALLASIPQLGQASRAGYHLDAIPGSVPSPLAFPQGCAFHPRCAYFQPSRCDAAGPPLENRTADHAVRCFRWREIQGERRS
jgi:oligopeptide transport system ATP-binding protein